MRSHLLLVAAVLSVASAFFAPSSTTSHLAASTSVRTSPPATSVVAARDQIFQLRAADDKDGDKETNVALFVLAPPVAFAVIILVVSQVATFN